MTESMFKQVHEAYRRYRSDLTAEEVGQNLQDFYTMLRSRSNLDRYYSIDFIEGLLDRNYPEDDAASIRRVVDILENIQLYGFEGKSK